MANLDYCLVGIVYCSGGKHEYCLGGESYIVLVGELNNVSVEIRIPFKWEIESCFGGKRISFKWEI